MQNHTKGPWRYEPIKEASEGFYIRSERAALIGMIGVGTPQNLEEIEANAKLIAEAPAQKEICQDLADRLNNGRSYLMEVDPKKLTVEDCLDAFGFGWKKRTGRLI